MRAFRLVYVFDPTDDGDGDVWDVPIGKQTNHPSHIFYRPCTGIWQTVWIESAPAVYIDDLHLNADMNGKGIFAGLLDINNG
jgi:hypothetical protein